MLQRYNRKGGEAYWYIANAWNPGQDSSKLEAVDDEYDAIKSAGLAADATVQDVSKAP